MADKKKAVAGLLQKTREEMGLSIKDVADDICVRSTYLKAIEAGDYSSLPEQTFAVGFVKAYAAALKLDADSVVSSFKDEIGFSAVKTCAVPVAVASAVPEKRFPAWLSPVAGLLGVSLCWVAFGPNLFLSGQTAPSNRISTYQEEKALDEVQASLSDTTLAEILAEETQQQAAEETSSTSDQNDTVKESSVEPQSPAIFAKAAYADHANDLTHTSAVSLFALEDSWVRLTDDVGTEIWSGVLREGEKYRPSHTGAIRFSTSNAGGVQLLAQNGNPIVLGERGSMVEEVALDLELQSAKHASQAAISAGSR